MAHPLSQAGPGGLPAGADVPAGGCDQVVAPVAAAVARWVEPRIMQKVCSDHGQPAMLRREAAGPGRSHPPSFDHRLRPETLRTAMATAFFCPTSTTSRLPRVTPV